MPSTTIAIADALTALLNNANLSQAFTAVRSYTPDFALPEMTTLRVTVVPSEREQRPAARTRQEYDHTFLVGIQQKIDPDEDRDGQIDALMTLEEEIAELLRLFALEGTPAQWVKTEAKPIFDTNQLHTLSLFTGVLAVTYRTWS